MNDHLIPAEDRIVAQLAATARGPKRNGVFAVWLFVRACEAELPPVILSGRARRRRLADLERRMSSLSMPPPMKKAIVGCLHELTEATPERTVGALKLLAAPAKEHLGAEMGDAIGLAIRDAGTALRQLDQGGQ